MHPSIAIPAVILLQGLIGFGIASRLSKGSKPCQLCALGLLIGLPVSSVVLLALEILGIPLRLGPLLTALALVALLVSLGVFRKLGTAIRQTLHKPGLPAASECVFLVVIIFLAAASLWQCIFFPVTPRDTLVGMDLVARYAVEEATLRSSVFTGPELVGHLSHQPFYAPFTTLMQVTFRLAGFAFGKIWLSLLFFAFLAFLYCRLRETLHPILTGALVVCFLSIPSMFSQTYLVLTDYSNAVFFSLSVLALHDYKSSRDLRTLLLSSLFMSFACWSRSETILFVPFALLFVIALSRGSGWRHSMGLVIAFAAAPVVLFLLWHGVYCGFYLDHSFLHVIPSSHQSLAKLPSVAWNMLRLMNAPELFGSMFYIFTLCTAANLTIWRDLRGADLLLWIFILLAGFVFIVLYLPMASVGYTVKRGYLKLFPIMLFYLAQTRLLTTLSERIHRWQDPVGCQETGDHEGSESD